VNGSERVASRGAGWRTYERDGWEILAGKGARDNDHLTFRVAGPQDFWLHASGYAGSHVVIRNPGGEDAAPREVVECAAQLAAFHSKARDARGKVEVHLCRASDVRKPRGVPAGTVELRRWSAVKVYPRDPFPDLAG
jgi:predicted ribosome quality control (RQC) complex YloA/Tae2 family protein